MATTKKCGGWTPQLRSQNKNDRTYYHATIAGQRVSLGTDEDRAKAEFHRLMAQHYGSNHDVPVCVAELVEKFRDNLGANDRDTKKLKKRSDWIRYVTAPFAVFAGGTTPLASLGKAVLKDYAKALTRPAVVKKLWKQLNREVKTNGKLSPQCRRHMLSFAIRCCEFGLDHDYIAKKPLAPKLPTIPTQPKDIPLEDLAEFFDDIADKPYEDIFTFMAIAGLRPEESCLLSKNETKLNRTAPVIILPPERHKNGWRDDRDKIVPLLPNVVAFLKTQAKKFPKSKFYFLNSKGKTYTPGGLRCNIRDLDLYPYKFRHTALQNLFDDGFEMAEVARLSGSTDKTMRSTQGYVDVRQARLLKKSHRSSSALQKSRALQRKAKRGRKKKKSSKARAA